MSRYAGWQQPERRQSARVAVMLLVAPVFLGLVPVAIAGIGPRLDRRLRLPAVRIGSGGRILGGVLSAVGFSIGFWSVTAQIERGRGTPLPTMPTQVLLTDGPFRYCRNPMTLGAILAYLGIALAARTASGVALVVSLAALLLAYLKGFEESELAERFGDPYLTYRAATPFLIPRLTSRHRVSAQVIREHTRRFAD